MLARRRNSKRRRRKKSLAAAVIAAQAKEKEEHARLQRELQAKKEQEERAAAAARQKALDQEKERMRQKEQRYTAISKLESQVNLILIAQSGEAHVLQELDKLDSLHLVRDVNKCHSFSVTAFLRKVSIQFMLRI